MNWKLGNQRSNGDTISITGNKLKGLLIRIIFNCMAKVIWDCFLLALLWSMIGQENTHHTLNKLNAWLGRPGFPAFRSAPLFLLSPHWLLITLTLVTIDCCDLFFFFRFYDSHLKTTPLINPYFYFTVFFSFNSWPFTEVYAKKLILTFHNRQASQLPFSRRNVPLTVTVMTFCSSRRFVPWSVPAPSCSMRQMYSSASSSWTGSIRREPLDRRVKRGSDKLINLLFLYHLKVGLG